MRPEPPNNPPSFLSRLMRRVEGYDEALLEWLCPPGDLVGTRHLGIVGISWYISLELNNVTEVGGRFRYCAPEITGRDLLFKNRIDTIVHLHR